MSKKTHRPFLQRVLDGEVLDLAEIDEDIAAWHESSSALSLAAWLGMTEEEYGLYLERADALRYIVQARAYDLDVATFIKDTASLPAVAARGANPSEVNELMKWLRKTNRIAR